MSRYRLMVAALALASACTCLVAGSSSAASIDLFVPVEQGETLTLSNANAAPATGSAQLVGGAVSLPLAIAANGSQSIPNALQALGSGAAAGIVRVRSDVQISTSDHALPLGFADAPLVVSIRNDAVKGLHGSLMVGLFGATVRVRIYDRANLSTPVAERTLTPQQELQTLDIGAIVPGGIVNGVATIEPLSGAAVGLSILTDGGQQKTWTTGAVRGTVATNVPPIGTSRRRAVRIPACAPPPRITVSTAAICALSAGVRVEVPAETGASWRWELLGGTAEGGTGDRVLTFSTKAIPYATVRVIRTVNGCVTTSEAAVVVSGVPTVSSLTATSVVSGQTATISWTVSNDALTGTLTGSDFPGTGTSVTLATGSYSYTTTVAGAKSVTLTVGNGCGSGSLSQSYTVSPACTAPSATITSSSTALAGSAKTATAPSGAASYVWSIDNGTVLSGQGTRSISFRVGASGTTKLTLTVSNGTGCSASDTHSVTVTQPTPSASVSVSPSTINGGNTATVTITVKNYPGTPTWSVSAMQNGIVNPTGSGNGTFTRTLAAVNPGSDTVRLEVNGVLVDSAGFNVLP